MKNAQILQDNILDKYVIKKSKQKLHIALSELNMNMRKQII